MMRLHRTTTALSLAALALAACTTEPPADAGFDPSGTGDEGSDEIGDTVEVDTGSAETDESGDPAPDEPRCGNDIIDGDDVCDGTDLAGQTCAIMGFEAGELACTLNCGGYDLSGCGFFECGNGDKEGEEDCDGTVGDATCASIGFDNGTLFCTPQCEYNTSMCGTCGNRDIEPAEDCDVGKDLEETCQSLGFDSGNLACGSDCLYDTTNCQGCGNDVIEGNEACDGDNLDGATCQSQLYDSGTLACLSSCADFDESGCGICGNGITDGEESCDTNDFGGETCVSQGFDSGGLTCNAACDTITTDNCGTCGNGVVDGSESCDGLNLNAQTCASLGLEGGTLACQPNCFYDFSGCDIQGVPFGSDAFYTGLSLEPGVLPCDEISGSGTDIGAGDDTGTVVDMGFAFPFYGTNFTDVTISSNGSLNFGSASPNGLSNQCLPGTFTSDDHVIAVFWDDLDPPDGVGGGVRHQTFGSPGSQRFVVQWDAPFFIGDANDIIRVQAVLHESGVIDTCYVDTLSAADSGNSGAEATAGIQLDTMNGIQFSCNTADLTNGLLLTYLPN